MDGGGEFAHSDGFQLKGLFKNNLYNHENKLFINPFNKDSVIKKQIENSEKYKVTCEK